MRKSHGGWRVSLSVGARARPPAAAASYSVCARVEANRVSSIEHFSLVVLRTPFRHPTCMFLSHHRVPPPRPRRDSREMHRTAHIQTMRQHVPSPDPSPQKVCNQQQPLPPPPPPLVGASSMSTIGERIGPDEPAPAPGAALRRCSSRLPIVPNISSTPVPSLAEIS